ncbi:hypothetical protein, partial [Escherichia coli]
MSKNTKSKIRGIRKYN